MADILGIISANYKTVGTTIPSRTPYTNVDPAAYAGTWQGTYSDKTNFRFDISNVSGFRAQVKYSSGGTVKFQQVLIKDGAFKLGDSKFTLQKPGHAQVKTVVVNPVTGGTVLNTAYATQS